MFWFEQYFLLIIVLSASVYYALRNKNKSFVSVLGIPVILFLASLLVYSFSGRGDGFNVLAFWGRWLCFSSVFGLLLFFIHKHIVVKIVSALSIISLSLLFYAYHVEPRWLEVREHQVTLAVKDPLTIVVLADFQTDHIGSFEKNIFIEINKLSPDVLLLPGDYLHLSSNDDRFNQLRNDFKKLLDTLPKFKYGAYAVSGDVETRQAWQSLFVDSSVMVFDGRNKKIRDDICLSGLDIYTSRRVDVVSPECGLGNVHIVFGHNPNFALSNLNADLLIAGHTHGGQVQIPMFGPLLTFSKVPNSWADGLTQITKKQTLIVSRGVGMERKNAPRVRFFARPELTVIRIVPES